MHSTLGAGFSKLCTRKGKASCSFSQTCPVHKAIIDHYGYHKTVQGPDLSRSTMVCAESSSSLCWCSDEYMGGEHWLRRVERKFLGVSSRLVPCRDAALHRREDRKRKRDEEKAAEKDKEKLKKIKEETEKQEPAAQLNGTRADVAKEDTPGQAQVKTEHIKEEPASAAVSEAAVIPNGDKVRHCCVTESVRLIFPCRSGHQSHRPCEFCVGRS